MEKILEKIEKRKNAAKGEVVSAFEESKPTPKQLGQEFDNFINHAKLESTKDTLNHIRDKVDEISESLRERSRGEEKISENQVVIYFNNSEFFKEKKTSNYEDIIGILACCDDIVARNMCDKSEEYGRAFKSLMGYVQ